MTFGDSLIVTAFLGVVLAVLGVVVPPQRL
jgi:hypothetical protein